MKGRITKAEVRKAIVAMILMTDMSTHFDSLARFQANFLTDEPAEIKEVRPTPIRRIPSPYPCTHHRSRAHHRARPPTANTPSSRPHALLAPAHRPPAAAARQGSEDQLFLTAVLLHAADISNPAKPRGQYLNWTDRVLAEFYSVGDIERDKDMDISMFCDRYQPKVAKCQVWRRPSLTGRQVGEGRASWRVCPPAHTRRLTGRLTRRLTGRLAGRLAGPRHGPPYRRFADFLTGRVPRSVSSISS